MKEKGPGNVGSPAGRRKLLKILAAGSGAAVFLPKKWTKPVVESVIVGAHAQTNDLEPE